MKKMVVVGLIGLGLGLVLPRVFAQSPQAERARERAGVGTTEVQKWEQFCEEHQGAGRAVRNGNASAAAHGQKGYQLFSSATWSNALILCYRRPAR